MKYILFPIVVFLFLTSCRKESPKMVDTGNPNNELKATVSVIGETTSLHKANGGHTVFARNIHANGDTVITVSGGIGEHGTRSSRKIEIWLINIPGPGTYHLSSNNTSNPRQQSWSVYTVGDVFFSTVFEMYFSRQSTAPGNVTIELLTPTEIRGTFTTNCSNAQLAGTGVNYAQITNGSFKGSF